MTATWRHRAVCASVDDQSIFFPGRGDHQAVDAAKAVCATCPVRTECLDDALTLSGRSDIGIRGGLSAVERHRLRRRLEDAA